MSKADNLNKLADLFREFDYEDCSATEYANRAYEILDTGWQPIATAPKDGSTIIGWFPDIRRPAQFTHWIDSADVEYGKTIRHRQEWYIYQISFGLDDKKSQPTHWMPVPSSPNLPSNPPREAPK